MKIIHLSSGQRRRLRVEHPLLDGATKMSNADILDAMTRFSDGDKAAREELIMGQMHTIKNIVGRFLANWPETRRFEEDMVSEGMVAVIELVDSIPDRDSMPNFAGSATITIQGKIEAMLNDSRSMFSACKAQNYNLMGEGEEVEYNYAQQLREDLDAGKFDDRLEWVDMLDELEHLGEQDKEHFRALILRCMEQEHNLEESDLTPLELEALNNLAKMICDL